jgi:hypothetical protein
MHRNPAAYAAVLFLCALHLTSSAAAGPRCLVTHHLVMLDMAVTLDQVAGDRPELKAMKVGHVDRLRIVYDADAVDPQTHRVALLNFQHYMHGRYAPERPDPIAMPMSDAWLDLGRRPYRMHLKAAVVHGSPILIEVDEASGRLTIRPQGEPQAVLVSGHYAIDPAPIIGRRADNAGTPR